MKIGLYDIDSKIPNLALMKLSAWHKKQGDEVELYFPLKKYDKVYASQIFTWSKPQYKFDELGGSGSEKWETILPDKIEHIYPDYSLYHCDYAMGFTSRGCIRNCPFCIVRKKEGLIHTTNDIYEFWNGQKKIMILDNNILALKMHFKKIANQIIDNNIIVDFCQGLDIRLINKENAELLSKMKHWKQIHFAFDYVSIEKDVRKGVNILSKAGIKPYRLMFYVLIGFNTTPEEDIYRVKVLNELGCDAYVCAFDKTQKYQRDFQRWVNHKAIFKSVKWEDYKKNKTIKVDESQKSLF